MCKGLGMVKVSEISIDGTKITETRLGRLMPPRGEQKIRVVIRGGLRQ